MTTIDSNIALKNRYEQLAQEGYSYGRNGDAPRKWPKHWTQEDVNQWMEGYNEGKMYLQVLGGM